MISVANSTYFSNAIPQNAQTKAQNSHLNESFKVLAGQYQEATKDIHSVENSLFEQLSNDSEIEKELNKFIKENKMPIMDAFIDKDILALYKSSASIEEFKAKWFELQDKRFVELAEQFLKAGLQQGFIISQSSEKSAHEILPKETSEDDSKGNGIAQNLNKDISSVFQNLDFTFLQNTFKESKSGDMLNFLLHSFKNYQIDIKA